MWWFRTGRHSKTGILKWGVLRSWDVNYLWCFLLKSWWVFQEVREMNKVIYNFYLPGQMHPGKIAENATTEHATSVQALFWAEGNWAADTKKQKNKKALFPVPKSRSQICKDVSLLLSIRKKLIPRDNSRPLSVQRWHQRNLYKWETVY